MNGYQNRPKVNAETFDEEGFMRTGDVVEIDGEGYIYILDRVKEVRISLIHLRNQPDGQCGRSSSIMDTRFVVNALHPQLF